MGNSSHFCTPVFMNMSNITSQKKVFRKKIFTIIFVAKSLKGFSWNNVGPASQMVAQH